MIKYSLTFYTDQDIINELKNIHPEFKTRKRTYIDPRNYLICILIYKFNYTEQRVADLFKGTKFQIDRSTVAHAKTKPLELVKDAGFLENIALVYEKFPFDIPNECKMRFIDKDIKFTLTNKQLCRINNYASNSEVRKSTAVNRLINLGLRVLDKNFEDMGRMKELFIEICNANNGQLPGDITAGDVTRMQELEIYNWEEYENYLKKERSTYTEAELKLIADAKENEKQKEKEPF